MLRLQYIFFKVSDEVQSQKIPFGYEAHKFNNCDNLKLT